MDLVLPSVVFGLTLLLDFLVYSFLPSNVKSARLTSAISVSLIVFCATSILFSGFSMFSVIFALANGFRAINSARVYANRMHPKAITRRFARTASWLAPIGLLSLYASVVNPGWPTMSILLWISLSGAVVMFINTVMSIVKWDKPYKVHETSKKLPTVSLCLPARNETQDLPGCIESLLASTYPKLEIIVLDDCSHDKTPELIKKYAHDGVRFIKGQEPDDDWLAKNVAMNKLFEESTGEVVVFVGVDVRFSTNTVQQIVQQFDGSTKMISVLPLRHGSSELSVFIQPLRYWWELVVPRFLGGRPPVLSACWAIGSRELKQLGDFESVKRSVQPEAHFARKLKSTYRFMLSGRRMGISSVKKPREQYNTALRTRYPQVKRRPEKVLLLLLAEITIFLAPLLGLYYGIVNDNSIQSYLSVSSLTLLAITNLIISMLVVEKTWIVGLFSLPFLLVEEWYLLVKSMLVYEFGIVRWKDRNICLPMLAVDKKLPKM